MRSGCTGRPSDGLPVSSFLLLRPASLLDAGTAACGQMHAQVTTCTAAAATLQPRAVPLEAEQPT